MSPVESSTGALQTQAAVAMTAKALDQVELEGALANQLIAQAAEPSGAAPARSAPPPADGVRGTLVNRFA
ncbi:MAG: hypothetical protein AAGN82_16640 [Myxococcota bacterium]